MDIPDEPEEWTEGMKRPFDAGLSDPGEKNAIFRVLDSFRQYRQQTHYSTTHRRRQNFYALPQAHQQLLKQPPIDFLDNLTTIDDAIDNNADIAEAILTLALETFGLPENPDRGSELDWHNAAQPLDMSKAHSTLRQFWRDWSREGFQEELRGVCELITQSLDSMRRYDSELTNETGPGDRGAPAELSEPYRNLLLPGAGLGRLVFELSLRGYNTEGNEISYHQLLASQFILNAVESAEQYTLHPFVGSFNNNVTREQQLRAVAVPDIHPGNALVARMQEGEQYPETGMPGQMNMTAGDFITSYSSVENAGSFDGVITVFFIDTAPNVIRYLETIYHCLREGGVWINIGPLLWHFEEGSPHKALNHEGNQAAKFVRESKNGIAEPGSIELSEQEVLHIAGCIGFDLISRSQPIAEVGGYIRDKESLMLSSYRCCHWVLKKRMRT